MDRKAPSRVLLLALIWLIGGAGVSWGLIRELRSHTPEAWHLMGPDVFFFLMATYEPVGLGFVIGAALLFIVFHRWSQGRPSVALDLTWRHALMLALAVFLVCFGGTSAVCHRFPLSMDEHTAFYQAAIFHSGHIAAVIPPNLVWLKAAIIPDFIVVHADNSLIEGYLPLYSALLALGTFAFGTPWIVNPLLSAGALVLIYGVGRNMSGSKALTGWALVFLATSTQFLLNGMSGFAMTSHLFFSLAWLFFYSHPDRRWYYLCPPLGVIALGLHQPICHILFVGPFLLRILLERRWAEVFYSIAVYLAGGAGWLYWMITTRPEANTATEKMFALPGAESAFVFLLSVLLLMTWENFLMVLFFTAALFKIRAMPAFVRDLALSAGIMLFFYLFFIRSQGSGWGYRYMFPVLGNLCLIAAWNASQYPVSRLTFAAFTVMALGLQLPFRCIEANQMVKPQLAFREYLAHLDADFVIVDRQRSWIWFTAGFVRNAPDFKNRPLVLYRERLTDPQIARLQRESRTVIISPEQENRDFNIPLAR